MSLIDPKFELPDADETARLRRVIKMQLAVIVSLVLHVALLVALALMPLERRAEIVAKAPALDAYEPPVPITFTSPQPRAETPTPARPAPPKPRPEPEPRFRQEVPPPNVPVDPKANYRMDPTGKILPASPKPKDAGKAGGHNDPRPAGGRAGGDLPRPTPGAPRGAPVEDATRADGAFQDSVPDTPDLTGRLRDFRRALAQPRPPSPTGPEGGGVGPGGIEVPRLPGVGFGVGNLEFESRDYDWSDYGRAIYWVIWRAWHNRLLFSVGNFERWAALRNDSAIDHTSGVRFTITKSGQIEDVLVETKSGCVPLDASAYDALREVVLPPLPDDFPRGDEKVHARFIATGDVKFMRRNLEWLKQNGYF